MATTLRLTGLLSLAALCALEPSAVADTAPPGAGVYVFDVTVAPVRLDGTFPLTIQTAGGDISGPLVVSTDVRGRLSGTLAAGGSTFTVTGAATYSAKGYRLSMTAKTGKESISFDGTLAAAAFTGRAKGKGLIAPGKNTFTLDVSLAGPRTASLVAVLEAGRHGKLSGTGTGDVGGVPLTLKARGSSAKSFSVTLSAKGFRFTGKGTDPISWKLSGFGVSTSGSDLPVTPLPAPGALAYAVSTANWEEGEPIPADVPTTPPARFTSYSVAPALPAGLSLDAASGAISGIPTNVLPSAVYVVTAANPAGAATANLSLGIRINRSKSFDPQAAPFSDDDYRHFLRRTQYGVRPSELAALQSQGLAPYVDAMLIFPTNTTAEQNAFPLLVNGTDPPGLQGSFPSSTQLARWWTQLMVDTQAPFQETLAFFWHDHFGVSSANYDGSELRWIADHVNLLRREGHGNFRTLLLDVARDPAMLKFLDGIQNRRGRPNENFAREVWELFTLGVGNGYTQADITEASKAWTGYKEVYDSATSLNNVVFDPARHDSGAKTFLGQTIPAQNATDDFTAAIDITLQNRPVAEYITKKLFEYFAYEAPPQALVDTMAAYLRSQDYDLKPFLKALLQSEAFFSKRARRSLVKSPVEYTVGFLRSTGLRMTTSTGAFDVAALDSSLNNQAQRPTQPPTVDGWPSGDLWLAAQGMVERINVAHVCVDDTAHQAIAGINVANLLPPVGQRTADTVVDTLVALLDVTLSATERADCVTYLNTLRDAAGNTTNSPFDGSSQAQLDERVRGLIWILAQHPTYQSR